MELKVHERNLHSSRSDHFPVIDPLTVAKLTQVYLRPELGTTSPSFGIEFMLSSRVSVNARTCEAKSFDCGEPTDGFGGKYLRREAEYFESFQAV